MSLKENVDFIKKEINTEEEFLVGFVKLERLYKKYKFLIILIVVLSIGGFIGIKINDYFNQQANIKANIAYDKLLKNPKDTKALAILKDTNIKLYNIIVFLNSNKETTNINSLFFKDLSEYIVALNNSDIIKLNSLTLNQNFILKEYAILNKAFLETKNKEYNKAKRTLKGISINSPVSKLANSLKHYLVTK
jgi:predicted negative regulator of RcsB-dependent stress response